MTTVAPWQCLTAERKSMTAAPHAGLRIQRKCACGAHSSSQEDECLECRSKKRLQPKLAIGASNDPLEAEADRAADRALREAASPAGQGLGPVPHSAGERSVPAMPAPASVDRALAGPATSLDPGLRRDMSRRFGYDFGRVQVHRGRAAEQSASEIGAEAYTVGQHVVFAAGRFAPATTSGRRLLAHELAHIIQQSTGSESPATSAGSVLRAKPSKPSAPKKPKVPMICGRPSRKVAGNSITQINLDVGTNKLTIEWADPAKAPPGSAGTHDISPGAGRCCVDCNDDTVSQTDGSLCTPKGDTWPVDHTGCALSGHPTAKNPTYFQRGGVAIHSGNVSAPPQSHGCARTSVEISELIHDNVVSDVTQVSSSGTWAGHRCYLTAGSNKLSNRKDVCDGDKLKSKTKGKKAKGGGGGHQGGQPGGSEAPAKPVAEALPAEEEDVVVAQEAVGEEGPEMAADGPGPNNEPAAHEDIGEIAAADVDEIGEGEAEGEGDTGVA